MNVELDYRAYLFSLVIILITITVATLFRRFFNRFILHSTRIIKNDPTNYRFLKYLLTSLIYIVGFSMAVYNIEILRGIAASLLAGAGILAIAVGFASQEALSNVISGMFIIIFKPYSINDRVTIKEKMSGVVEDITLRHTVIRDFENRRIVIPNSVISNEVIVNADLGDQKVCRFVEIGISYDSSIKTARRIMQEEARKHPLFLDNRTPEQIEEGIDDVVVRVLRFGDSSIQLRASVWAANQSDGFALHCDMLENIKERFDAEGIEIPFPYRTLVIKNPGMLKERL